MLGGAQGVGNTMESIEAKILLKNLLYRVVVLEDGSKELSGKLTESELEALNFALDLVVSSQRKLPAHQVDSVAPKPKEKSVNKESVEPTDSILLRPLTSFGLSVRTVNCLNAEYLFLIRDLLKFTVSDLLKVPNLGRKGLNEITSLFAENNLSLKQNKVEEPQVQVETKDEDTDAVFELETSVLDLEPPSEDVRLCIDFGTAMSKVTLVDNRQQYEDITVLKLGVPGDQEEISEIMLVSSVYIDNKGLLWFGQKAVENSASEGQSGDRQRLDNIKRWLSEEGFDEKVNRSFNPTEIDITYGNMIQAYLMFLTWIIAHCLEGEGYPINILRRFAMPIFEGEKQRDTKYKLQKMLGDAQVLADSFYRVLRDGIPLETFMKKVHELDEIKAEYNFIAEDITEPLGVAGSLLSWENRVNSLIMVVDIGAGTSDFSLFRIAFNPDGKKLGSSEVAGSARGITEAGNYLDKLLNAYILKKAEVKIDDPHYRNIVGALNLTIRDNKEALFNDDFVSVSLFNGEIAEVNKDEFLSLDSVKQFAAVLKETMIEILEEIDESWIKGAPAWSGMPTLAIALTGGGATLPMAKNLAVGKILINGNRLKIVLSNSFPQWLEEEGFEDLEEDYPQIAVSLGGARKLVLPHGDSAAITAGDIKETAVLGGFFQRGS
jgi:hypothetical protein